MRRSGWILPGAAIVAWLAAVGWPLVALVAAAGEQPAKEVEVHGMAGLLATSASWALAVAAGAVAVGWVPGRLLGHVLPRRGWLPLAALMLAPICLPAYVVFYAWWQSWPADSALAAWAIETGRLPLVKGATLYLGLLCWSWPLVAWCVAAAAAATPAEREELLRLDGAGLPARLVDRLRRDAPGLALGGLVVFVFVLNNTASFDIAQIITFGYELRAIDDLGAGVRTVLGAAAPAIAIALAGSVGIWVLVGRRLGELAVRPPSATAAAVAATAVIWALSTVVPVALFAAGLARQASPVSFARLYGGDLAHTAWVAAAAGLAAAVVAVGLAASWQDHRPWVRALAHAQALGWLLAAVSPGIVVGVACEAAWNRPGLDRAVYGTPLILVLGYLARFGFVAALLGRWLAAAEPRALADLRRLDGAGDLAGFVRVARPRLVAAAGAAFAIVAVLSMSELSVTARLQPAGFAVIAQAILHAVHYQRPDTVLLATLAQVALGCAAAFAVAAAWRPMRRKLYLLPLLLAACTQQPGEPQPLDARLVFGAGGLSLGQFSYPRGIAVDAARKVLYVVDKTARVQRFDFAGTPQLEWRMPEWDLGKPTGLGVAPDGRVLVADTHYHRVIAYDPDGHELMRFGSYGQGPGEFIYPTDVTIGPQGRIYVSEYGGNERIDVFDADGGFLFSFGSMGSEVGCYNRPQAMTFNADMSELYIADACNHRIVVVDPQGEPLRVLGRAGRGPGELAYPYDVMMLDDGTLLVCEFGNNRIQHLSPEGECLGIYGRVGGGDGELRYPWGVDGTGGAIFVLDSGNNRVQVIDGV